MLGRQRDGEHGKARKKDLKNCCRGRYESKWVTDLRHEACRS